MSMRSLGRTAALFAITALGVAACAPHTATSPAVPLQQNPPPMTTTAPPVGTMPMGGVTTAPLGSGVTTMPMGSGVATVPFGAGLVPSLDAPATPRPVTTTPFNQQVIVQNTTGVGVAPVYSPPTAQPRGVAPSDPSQYVTSSTVSVAGRVVSISVQTGSFLLQTPSEGWTVVLPVGASAPSVAVGRTLTVTGYAHRSERNQLLATSISP